MRSTSFLTLTSGSAQYTTTQLPVGTNVVSATYSGNGDLFGSTSPALNQLTKFQANFHVLYNFSGGADGANPSAGVSQDSGGNLYGVTSSAGNLNCPMGFGNGCGTVFKLDTNNNLTVLHSFSGTGGDGANPEARPILDPQNVLYGTTVYGGVYCPEAGDPGCGTVFQIPSGGNETVLHAFTGTGGDGGSPLSGLVLDTQGNLYGSTQSGGAEGVFGYGTVFQMSPSGQENWIYSFQGYGANGSSPSGLTRPDSQGSVYGTTYNGGPNGCGDIFKIDSTGRASVLYSFTGRSGDGCDPEAAMVRDSSGNLYGTSEVGGANYLGTVFELSSSGQESSLYSFTGKGGDGYDPTGRLVRDTSGNLYGATRGGAYGCGVVFKVTLTGQESVLYTFSGTGGDGCNPNGEVLADAQGNVYGTTSARGANGYGMVFKITP